MAMISEERLAMKIMGVLLIALFLASFARAQQTWTRAYGGSEGDDQGFSIQQTTDGGYIIAGSTNSYGSGGYDVYLIKTDASGDTLWTRTYGGRRDDWACSVQQTSDGGYIVAGFTESFRDTLYGDVYLIKTNASGDTLWTRTYGGDSVDEGYSVQQTLDGGYIVAGWTNSFGAGSYDVYLIRTNASGDTLWTKTYGGTGGDLGYCVRQTADGGYMVTGYTHSFGVGHADVYLIKTNASGDTLWTRTYGGTDFDEGYSVRQTMDGGYVIAGVTFSFGAGQGDVYLVKTNAAGDTLWTRTYGGKDEDWGWSVEQTLDGGYIISGYSNSFGSGSYYVYLIKTDASGYASWTKTYGGAGWNEGYSVQQTTDGGYVVAGYTTSLGPGGDDVYVIKTDANGNVGVEEPKDSIPEASGIMRAAPNPFASFTRIVGHEAERFDVYDIAGKMVGTYRGNRVGEGLAPAVYFIKLKKAHGSSLRIVKVR
jgi:hypothetical protein